MAGGLQRGAQRVPTAAVAVLLLRDVRVVGQGHGHRVLHRGGHDHARVLAGVDQGRHELRIPRGERGAVAGEVGLLGQRVDAQQARQVAAGDLVGQDAGHDGPVPRVPAELGVALVPAHHGAHGTGGVDRAAQRRRVQHGAGGVGRRVGPHEAHPLTHLGRQRVEVVRGHGLRPGQQRAHRIGGVGGLGVDDDVACTQPEQRGQPRDELLGPDRGHHGRRVQPGHPAAPGVPVDDRAAQGVRAVRRRVAVRVGGLGQGPADQRRRRIHRRSDGQVRDAVRVGGGTLTVGGERVPRVVRQRQHGAQASAFCRGRAEMIGWSLAIMPSLAAPPGEPRSSKNSTLAL